MSNNIVDILVFMFCKTKEELQNSLERRILENKKTKEIYIRNSLKFSDSSVCRENMKLQESTKNYINKQVAVRQIYETHSTSLAFSRQIIGTQSV